MGPIGWPELIILLVVVLIVFGPGKLPDIGNAIGKGVREFRKASNDLEESIRGDTKKPRPRPRHPRRRRPPATAPTATDPAVDGDGSVSTRPSPASPNLRAGPASARPAPQR